MIKEPFTDKLIKRFYGIAGPLDEYKRREVDRLGNTCFVYLATILLFGNLVAILLANRYAEMVAFAYPVFLEGLIFLLFGYIMVKGKKARVSDFEVEELSDKEKKQLTHVGLRTGLSFGLSMYVMQAVMQFFIDSVPLLETLTSLRTVVTSLVQGILFGGFMHLIVKARQKKEETND